MYVMFYSMEEKIKKVKSISFYNINYDVLVYCR